MINHASDLCKKLWIRFLWNRTIGDFYTPIAAFIKESYVAAFSGMLKLKVELL